MSTCKRTTRFLADRTAACTQYDRLLASYCRLSVGLSVALCTVAKQ